MFDHIGIVVTDLDVARRFYSACLEPLGIGLLENNAGPDGAGWLVFGSGAPAPFFVVAAGRPTFWLEGHRPSMSPDHLAFVAPDTAAVDAFYRAGIANGGTDNGAPGPRLSSTAYYGAYLIDPDGNNVEAGVRNAGQAQ